MRTPIIHFFFLICWPLSLICPRARLVPAVEAHLVSRTDALIAELKADPQVTAQPGIAINAARECQAACAYLRTNGHRMAAPLLALIGTNDRVVSLPIARQFVDDASSTDKEFVSVDGGWHLLLHEPEHRDMMIKKLTTWIRQRL